MNSPNFRLFDFIYYQANNHPLEDAISSKENGVWKKFSTQEYINLSKRLSIGLLNSGLKAGDKIGIISNNRYEWNIVDIAIQQAGLIGVPIYPTISAKEYEFIFNDAEIKLAFVSDNIILDKINSIKNNIPSIKKLYSFDKISNTPYWEELLAADLKEFDKIQKIMDGISTKDLATIIYTSGTTGVPKGVMLSHNNIASNTLASSERFLLNAGERALSFLPLCHIYERMMIYLYQYTGISIYYAESLETIGDNARELSPNVFSAVPRLLEKVYGRIMAKGLELTGIKKSLFFWAVRLAEKYEPFGDNGTWYEFKLKIARKLIFSKWQAALGGKVKKVASGSAALNPRLARIFNAAGIPVMEGYGLSETSPVISVNCEANRGIMMGTTGRPIRDVEVKIAADGEILIKGPNVMMGYYKRDDLTAEVIDKDGWFHTGDIGVLEKGEYLKITDRKKEIFKTSGGKYIAPQVLENKLKESSFIEQVIIVGENKNFPSAIISPNFEFIKNYCTTNNIPFASNEAIVLNTQILKQLQLDVDKINEDLGKWEQVKKIILLPHVWSIDTGELTPTMKLKRKFILEKYATYYNTLYTD
jgi:long-chain acyl-CoA synthetase